MQQESPVQESIAARLLSPEIAGLSADSGK